MIDFVKQMLTGQFEASLAMLNQCIEACPPEHWEGKIAQGTFRWVAYHTLFFVDLYLTTNEESFELRDIHENGGDERRPVPSVGLSKDDLLKYVPICRQKMLASIAAETPESLAGPSGFSWYTCSRGELHLVNIRHIQHHTGQLSAFVRRVDDRYKDRKTLSWIASGWRC
jgi:DinB superfamily